MTESLILYEKGKGCLVMHVRSAMYTLFSQLSILSYFHFLSLFLSFFTFNSLFLTSLVTRLFLFLSSLFSWLLCVLPIFMGIVPFIPNINLMWFPFFVLTFHQPFFSVAGTQHILTVYRWVHSHYLLAVGCGFSPTTCLVTNLFSIFG